MATTSTTSFGWLADNDDDDFSESSSRKSDVFLSLSLSLLMRFFKLFGCLMKIYKAPALGAILRLAHRDSFPPRCRQLELRWLVCLPRGGCLVVFSTRSASSASFQFDLRQQQQRR